jgi:3-keto-L-gulonate-6-phosphate decarboxylase
LSIAVAAGIDLVIIAIIAILVGVSVVGRAVVRNENRAESEQDREQMERVSGEQSR